VVSVPAEGNRIFKGDKNPQHDFLRREENLSVPFVRFYGMLKNPTNMKEILRWHNSVFQSSCSFCFATR
jgi:hypothetical protein